METDCGGLQRRLRNNSEGRRELRNSAETIHEESRGLRTIQNVSNGRRGMPNVVEECSWSKWNADGPSGMQQVSQRTIRETIR